MLTAVIAVVASLAGVTLGALVEQAKLLGNAEEDLHLPERVREATVACEWAIEDFARIARKHTS